MNSFPPPPAGLDITETRVPDILGALLTTWALATIAFGLRIWAHRVKGNPLGLADSLAFFALICASGHVFVIIAYMVPHGSGIHIWVAPPDAVKVWALGLFIAETLYALTLVSVKLSTLFFYRRVFGGGSNSIVILIWVLTAIVGGWGVAALLSFIFTCVPTRATWERFDPVHPMSPTEFHCDVNSRASAIAISVVNIITDAAVVLVPVPYVCKLQVPKPQKIALLCIFLIGAFVTILSIIRLVFIIGIDLESIDITWNFSNAIIWSNLEANIAIMCGCLPFLKPLLSLAVNGTLTLRSRTKDTSGMRSGENGTKQSGSRTKSRSRPGSHVITTVSAVGPGGDGGPYASLGDQSSYDGETGSAVELASVGRNQSPEGIVVTRKFQIQTGESAI